jgi:asparagine synthase (glutamine-hydrolysing)
MCGIAGFVDSRCQTPHDDLKAIANGMAETLRHRGPDSEGVWVDAAAGIALGHRRLAIIDLSAAGDQPMLSGSGRFVIVYNGELYNFQELRGEFAPSSDYPVTFRGQADTEVMLACFDRWGVKASLPRFNGMFAFAAWDRQEHILHLSRDRMGEKPLYYGWVGDTFLFGSELKALCAHPKFRGEINREALTLYMRHNCVPAPHSIYHGIYKLSPGNLLSLPGDHAPDAMPVPYWSLGEAVARVSAKPFLGTTEEAINELDTLLRDAIRIRMLADVPLGGFLSGGVDSSIVTALMQAQSSRPVKTFTIGFRENAYDEAQSAAAVAQHLGTEHRELYVTPAEALSVIPKLPTMYDEPFADSSQIPTFLVSQMARRYVTVGLSGDGGDELFGGYNRHVWSNRIWDAVGWLPLSARSCLAGAVRSLTPQAWDRLFGVCAPFLPGKANQRNPGLKLHKIAEMLSVEDRGSLYLRHTSHWADPADVVIGGTESEHRVGLQGLQEQFSDFAQQMMFLDTVTYLPDDILAKVDRASMAVSLEARVPLLDHRVVEFAWSLPLSLKIRDGEGKWLLRELLYRYVSRDLIDRPKTGFGIPIEAWLRGPLRDWADALLDEHRLQSEGFFNPAPIRKIWAAHLSGRGSWQYHLWDVLMFQAWLEENRQLPDSRLPGTVSLNAGHTVHPWKQAPLPQDISSSPAPSV